MRDHIKELEWLKKWIADVWIKNCEVHLEIPQYRYDLYKPKEGEQEPYRKQVMTQVGLNCIYKYGKEAIEYNKKSQHLPVRYIEFEEYKRGKYGNL